MRTLVEYISKLEKMKDDVYMGGEFVERTDPKIRPGINVLSVMFDLASMVNPIMESIVLMKEYDIESKNISRYLADIKKELDQSKYLTIVKKNRSIVRRVRV